MLHTQHVVYNVFYIETRTQDIGMRESLWRRPSQLQELLGRAAEAASFSGRKVMKTAGLTGQCLNVWKKGKRVPRPDNVRAFGQALILRGQRLTELGTELIRSAEEEERLRIGQSITSSL